MYIALTKKLATAMAIKPAPISNTTELLFTWTANWTKVWNNRRSDDMLVLVNHATRFTVAIYQVKRSRLNNVVEMLTAAIRNTLLTMNMNVEIVDEYMRLAGEVEFVANHNRQATAWVNKAGAMCAFHVGHEYNGIAKMFNDTIGVTINHQPVNYSGNTTEVFYPKQAMFETLAELTGKPAYNYRAFELLVTLDLDVYQAKRRLIVPADIEFARLHKLLQRVYSWNNYHLHDFTVLDGQSQKNATRLVTTEIQLSYDSEAVLEAGHKLSEYFPKYTQIIYTYDMGDNWEHYIELVRVIKEHNEESPYLLEAVGQAPPEDVGGVGGFIDFREIMLDPNHPDYDEIKEWAGFWQPDLPKWETKPKVINC